MYIREPFPKFRLTLSATFGKERQIQRLSPRETLHHFLHTRCSISRFGDGELRYCLKRKDIDFQPFRPSLADRLLNAILTRKTGLLTCYNNMYRDSDFPENIVEYGGAKPYHSFRSVHSEYDIGRRERRKQRRAYVERWLRILRRTDIETFGEACFFRIGLYVEDYENGEIEDVKREFRSIFYNRSILFICPRSPLGGLSFAQLENKMKKFGMKGSDYLFVPETDAASIEPKIIKAILDAKDFTDIFIQAGPLATVLSFELSDQIQIPIVDVGALNTQLQFL